MKNFKLLKKRFTTKGKEQKYSDNKSKTKQIKVTQTIKLEKKNIQRIWAKGMSGRKKNKNYWKKRHELVLFKNFYLRKYKV